MLFGASRSGEWKLKYSQSMTPMAIGTVASVLIQFLPQSRKPTGERWTASTQRDGDIGGKGQQVR